MRIQIIGGSGTGKSTLAKYVSEQENIHWIDTDNYLWKDDSFTENFPIEERKEMYRRDMEVYKEYVASGSIFSWCREGFTNRDLLVFLSLDENARMDRLQKRERERKGQFWQTSNGVATNDFLEWCKTYLTADDKEMMGTYAEHAHQMDLAKCPVLKLDSSLAVAELYAEMKNFYKKNVSKN